MAEKDEENIVEVLEEGEEIQGYESFEVIEVDGTRYLIITEDKYVELANYIEEVETDRDKERAKRKQAEKEVDKAYKEDDAIFSWKRADDMLTGAGVAALLILIAEDS